LGDRHPLALTMGKSVQTVLEKAQKYPTMGRQHTSPRSGPQLKAHGSPSRPASRPLPEEEGGDEDAGGLGFDHADEDEEDAHGDRAGPVEENPTPSYDGSPASFHPSYPAAMRRTSTQGSTTPRGGRRGSQLQSALEFAQAAPSDVYAPSATSKPAAARQQRGNAGLEMMDDPGLMKAVQVTRGRRSGAVQPDDLPPLVFDQGPPKGMRVTNRSPRQTAKRIRADAVATKAQQKDEAADRRRSTAERHASKAPPASRFVETLAAERIQKSWRKWKLRTRDYAGARSKKRLAATRIQARWRSYAVRKHKLFSAAAEIQRHVRGFQLRLTFKRHHAAGVIQRCFAGYLCRKELRFLHNQARRIQEVVRRAQDRKKAQQMQDTMMARARMIQRTFRRRLLRLRRQKASHERQQQEQRIRCATNMQRYYRGWKGRERASARKAEWQEEQLQRTAATRIQSAYRQRLSRRDAAARRSKQLRDNNSAAVRIRKNWLRYITRKKFVHRMKCLKESTVPTIVIQRYARGYLLRNRLWHEAIHSEERQWASIEVQRVWRGYLGRLAWGRRFEERYSQEAAATRLQRFVRGWLARTRVMRMKRRIARQELEQARRRFKAAQLIQARVRGVQTRMRMLGWFRATGLAARRIQRCWRGYHLRQLMWQQVLGNRVLVIQATVRMFLVQCRQRDLVIAVKKIQRFYRWKAKNAADQREHLMRRPLNRKSVFERAEQQETELAAVSGPTP